MHQVRTWSVPLKRWGTRIAGQVRMPGKTDYGLLFPAPSSAPVSGSEWGSDLVRADIALTGVACSAVSVTLALPSPPSTAGWGLNVIKVLIAVPASANLSTFRHIVVLVGEFLDWRQFSRREIITNGLQRLLKGELMRRLTRHQKRQRILHSGSSVTLISRS